MVLPLIGWGLIAVGTAGATYFLSNAGGSKSSQDTTSEQTSKNESKLGSEIKSEVKPETKTISNTTNTQTFNYDFGGSSLYQSSLDLGRQSLTPNTTTSPKVDAKVTPTATQGTTTTPAFTNTQTPTAVTTTEKTSTGFESLFQNPLLLAGVGFGAWYLLSEKKGGKN